MKMKLKKGEKILIGINAISVAVFASYYLHIKNYEFLWYIGVMIFFFVLILATLHRSQFDYPILIGLSIWGFLHMAGGGIVVNGDVLYAFPLIPIIGNGDSLILKYDQFVHFWGFGVSTLVVYHLLKHYLNERANWNVVYVLIILAGMGVGVLNEIVEFAAVLSFPETGVGGYYNTMIDSVFNAFGAIAAVAVIHSRRIRLKSIS